MRARPVGKRIAYSIVDEYDTEFEILPATSTHPLTLENLVGLIDDAGFRESLGVDYTVMNYESVPKTQEWLDELRHFTEVESLFYPQINDHYRQLAQSWYLEEKERLKRECAGNGGPYHSMIDKAAQQATQCL